MTRAADVLVIGAGIVGAACAFALAQAGKTVRVLDAGWSGATGAGMGHLVVMDEDPAELALSSRSVQLWRELRPYLDVGCAFDACGTLWVAADEEEKEAALQKRDRLARHGVDAQWLDAAELAAAEPALRSGLIGGLRVAGDAIVYAPRAARWLLGQSGADIVVERAQVTRLGDQTVYLADGGIREAAQIVLANGIQSTQLCPDLPIRAKKGHLLITDRYPRQVHHQLLELGYAASAHQNEGSSVAFNVQPRPTGQLLIGSSREFDRGDQEVDVGLLQRMVERALQYLPALSKLEAIRSWTGLRPTTPDGLPLLGRHPSRRGLWLAVGHEGLGVTTATGSAELMAALMTGARPVLDPQPFSPYRFAAVA